VTGGAREPLFFCVFSDTYAGANPFFNLSLTKTPVDKPAQG